MSSVFKCPKKRFSLEINNFESPLNAPYTVLKVFANNQSMLKNFKNRNLKDLYYRKMRG